MKNNTRLSSLLGTWTGQTRMKALAGPYEMDVYFIVHLMPDPLRGYGCIQPNCTELMNHVCVEQRDDFTQKCVSLQDGPIEWSDVSAFFYFGARVDAGIPFNVHVEHTTGGWIGPLNIILAQNTSTTRTSDDTIIMDHYSVRYAETPTTSLLHNHPNCTLFGSEDFEKYFGKTAVQTTVREQVHATSHDGEDPYAPYLKTCENGNLKPILPLFDFVFINDTTKEEKLEIKLDYKILTFPKKGAPMYKLFPTLQERLNRRKGEFHISGPYCYGNDSNRGWTFDFNYDSKHESDYMTLVHGCVEGSYYYIVYSSASVVMLIKAHSLLFWHIIIGLPCVPSAGEISVSGAKTQVIHKPATKTATFGSEVFLTILAYALSMALLISITYNCKLSRRAKHDQHTGTRRRPVVGTTRRTTTATPGPYGDMEHPLLEHEQEEEAAGERNEDETDKTQEVANIQFV